MAKMKKTQPEGWRTTRKERINYYIGDLGRSLEGYIVTAMMTLFLLFPFSRLVHIWSAPVEYLTRKYQIVRARR